MKKLLFWATGLVFLAFSACVKDEPVPIVDEPVVIAPTDSVLSSGTFQNAVHTVSGSVRLIRKTDGSHILAFENFSTDSGPDLRVYLSTDKAASDFTEVFDGAKAGNFSLEVPATAKISEQKMVLIWCQAFSVLFGSAELK